MIRFVGHMEKCVQFLLQAISLAKQINEMLLWLQIQKSFAEFSKHEACE